MNLDELGVLVREIDKKVDRISEDNLRHWQISIRHGEHIAVLKDRSDGAKKAAMKSGLGAGMIGSVIIVMIKAIVTIFGR